MLYRASLHRASSLALLLAVLAFSAGCGGGSMGEVHGKITFDGKPVTAGSVTFAPQGGSDPNNPGRSATGTPNDKGEFQLSTHTLNDGARVGQHLVTYSAPQPPETTDPELRKKMMKAYQDFGSLTLPENHTVEIKSGRNDIVLELKKGK
jgi:hypothetical protein